MVAARNSPTQRRLVVSLIQKRYNAGVLRTQSRLLSSSLCLSSPEPRGVDAVPDFGFAFDIDGVLIRSSRLIPRAAEALRLLDANRIPYVLLTNGGGKLEADRVADLRYRLGADELDVKVTERNFIQSHTPFAALHDLKVARQPNEAVLVIGGEHGGGRCRAVAEAYGFQSVVTAADLVAAEPGLWPFAGPHLAHYITHARPLPAPLFSPSRTGGVSATIPVDPSAEVDVMLAGHLRLTAILVFCDPVDWALDAAIVIDALLSHRGYLGTLSATNGDKRLPNQGFLAADPPELHFSNPDLWWAAGWHLPRLGQGGFRAAIEGVWRQAAGPDVKLPGQLWGKPTAKTYQFAESVLVQWRDELVGSPDGSPDSSPEPTPPLRQVYMVGDNPESDIQGANEFQSGQETEWSSLLVKTGVFRETNQDSLSGSQKPTAVVGDAYDAVLWGLRHSGWVKPESD